MLRTKIYIDLTDQKFNRLKVLKLAKVVPRKSQKSRTYYWECLCDCGNKTIISTQKLRSGQISCGCYKPGRLPKGVAFLNKLFYKYKKDAISRGFIFDLKRDVFEKIIEENCHYCGSPPRFPKSRIQGFNGAPNINGIDRKDNKLGYTKSNSIPCCGDCNKAKSGRSYDSFCKWLDVIALFRNKV